MKVLLCSYLESKIQHCCSKHSVASNKPRKYESGENGIIYAIHNEPSEHGWEIELKIWVRVGDEEKYWGTWN